jgi:hypothetical protein
MAQADFERVLGRALTDASFREALLANAKEACQGYDLTAQELEVLENLETEHLTMFASSLGERISKTGGIGFA